MVHFMAIPFLLVVFLVTCTNHSPSKELVDLDLDSTDIGPGLDEYRAKEPLQVYYVDAIYGSDDADGKSPESAWKSLDKAHEIVFEPGVVLRLARGSIWKKQHILLDQNVQGTADSPIVIEAYGDGELPTIEDPRALWDKAKPFPALYVSETAKFVHILELRIRNGGEGVAVSLDPGSRNIVIGGMEISGFGTGIHLAGEHQKVVSNYIHEIGMDGTGSGIGIGIVGKDLDISFNRIEKCRLVRDGVDDGGALEFYNYMPDVGYDYLSDSIWIHHNHIHQCFDFMESYGNVTHMVISHNLYTDSPNEALEFHFDDSEHETWTHTPTYEVDITYNTFAPAIDAPLEGWGIIGLLVDWVPEHNPDPTMNRIAFHNNIFVTNYQIIAFRNVLGESLEHSHNLYYFLENGKLSSDLDGVPLGPTERIADPLFRDPMNGDYHLSAHSPAIGMGTEGSDVGAFPYITN